MRAEAASVCPSCWLVATATAWLVACAPQTEPATEVVVEVQSDLGNALASVEVEVRDAADKTTNSSHPFALSPALQLPFSFAVSPATGAAARSFVVVATGRDPQGGLLAQAKAQATFEPKRTIGPLVLFLSAACSRECDRGQACVANADAGASLCAAIPLPTLTSFRPSPPTSDAGNLHDGGTTTMSLDSGQAMVGAPIAIGKACEPSSRCEAGASCVDGFCCKSACASPCSACNVPGSEGSCTPLPSGQSPAPGHGSCGPDPKESCLRDGSCDGNGQCAKWALQTVCKAASCEPMSNAFTPEATCDGEGICLAPSAVTCAPWQCMPDQTACYASCSTGGAECTPGNTCENGSCGQKPLRSSCAGDGECMGNHCVDGVCCDGACDGVCQACDLSASRGSCTTLGSGQPHNAHGSCNGTGTACGGQCGGDPKACSYPGSGTSCRDQSCSLGLLTLAAGCDGAGSCPSGMQSACAPPSNASATCNGASCSFSCNDGFIASGNQCEPCGHAGETCCTGPFAPCVAGTACGSSNTCDVNDLYVFGWEVTQSPIVIQGAAMHFDGISWGPIEIVFPVGSGASTHVNGAWANAPGHYYAIGDRGELAESLGGSTPWLVCTPTSQCDPTNTTEQLGAIYGFGYNDRWIADGNHEVLHYTTSWTSVSNGLTASAGASSLWGTSSSDLWLAGGFHYNGSSWVPSAAINTARAFWGSATDDVWAVGDTINHWDGVSWSPAYAVDGQALNGASLYAISGSASGDVWAVGSSSSATALAAHWDGSQWSNQATGLTEVPRSVWVASKKQAWIVGTNLFTLNGSQWSQVTLPALPSDLMATAWYTVYGSAKGGR